MIARLTAALLLLITAACASPSANYWSNLSTGVAQTQRKGN